ncbi:MULTISPECIES: hypothetical protein [Bradyrhizobium]|uniref:hypothetical protein n=1 Tax=Bradyrhizobium TaxID=374 RepID=UPI0005766732|nr:MULTISPECIES: hypothetical protein [Bradyrhizobium]MBR0944925.1 hypothetical protein [Bradyrhizobium liaoningense]MBR1033520.1 hypothetical protein [Bradyrhizobium liaoningense]MDI2074273.1 hypothetical protein [Bradyrhizobium sp. Mp27]
MNKDEVENLEAVFSEGNKENSIVTDLGDLYVNLLRCSRSQDHHYRVQAWLSLKAFLQTLALKPVTPMLEVIDRASKRVGWQKSPSDEHDRALKRICAAAVTFMIAASAESHDGFLAIRREELVRRIEHFNALRSK